MCCRIVLSDGKWIPHVGQATTRVPGGSSHNPGKPVATAVSGYTIGCSGGAGVRVD